MVEIDAVRMKVELLEEPADEQTASEQLCDETATGGAAEQTAWGSSGTSMYLCVCVDS